MVKQVKNSKVYDPVVYKKKLLAMKEVIDLRQENKEMREEVEKRLVKWDRLLSKKDPY